MKLNISFAKTLLLSLLDDPMGIRPEGFYNVKALIEEIYQEDLPDSIEEIFNRVRICEGRAFYYDGSDQDEQG